MADDEPDADGYARRGKVFCMRLADDERQQLLQLQREAEPLLPWSRRRSLGGFIAWAALQWKPPGEEKPRNGRDVDGTVYRNSVAVARRVATKPARARAGNTGRPGGRAKAKGKKARR